MEIRAALASDVVAMAKIRAAEWETQEYWERRIAGYMDRTVNAQHALAPRACFVAENEGEVIGFVAGHRTTRHGCTGELEWINVEHTYRGSGAATVLLHAMTTWFIEEGATHVCVDVAPANVTARRFYTRRGALELNAHWLVWPDIGEVLSG